VVIVLKTTTNDIGITNTKNIEAINIVGKVVGSLKKICVNY